MTTVIAFIFMFGLLVFVHEWGHMIFAKRAGMLVREFAIGFGPKIFSFTKNETLYTIRLIPAGGYVRVAGEDPEIIELKPGHHIGLEFNEYGKVDKIIVNNKSKHPNARVIEVERVDLDHELIIEGYEMDEDERLVFKVDRKAFFIMDERKTQIAPYDRQFASKSAGQKAMQLFAGPMMNFILAIILFLIIGLVHGVPVDEAKMGEIQPNTPAEQAGLMANDEIIKIEDTTITTWEEFTTIVRENPGEELSMTVLRNGEEKTLNIVPKEGEAINEKGETITIGQIGVRQAFEKSMIGTVKYGFEQTYTITKMVLTNLGMLITGQVPLEILSGPVGIYDATDQVVQSGFISLIMWTAMLSVNLGIVNLVPLPALDGGRLLFVGIEKLRGKPVPPEKEGVFHFIGFALLMLLMIVVTWNDIQRLFL
ncbi:RIP metalloprotease RseP [Oceanobacillus caeni]|uniref:Zinc metalloprotease n=1 Tax=Oceanobacillus caeni TaxID=405946 RepID=A0ABR5MLE7_9BACI|nr:RIP metalloprotease RseP [Oceanobacillus caeni]KKE78400.1 zinc metalloprotease [Bacilli bacterium VT-13-104]PZD88644.1 RIP metalloprotease RseP [Bacilli bacterium]KPH76987.1 zinc metalloprotease [Oceanobacillus caeni]MCR1833220.1 RIP metalloprotease RseP [Oceanobacillus caeni]PZD89936.1 RIP metalloprotease RseP [Bacilli bacterium]